MELFLSRQNDQIALVLDTCGRRCSVIPLSDLLEGCAKILKDTFSLAKHAMKRYDLIFCTTMISRHSRMFFSQKMIFAKLVDFHWPVPFNLLSVGRGDSSQ